MSFFTPESKLSSASDSRREFVLADIVFLILLILHVAFIAAWLGGGSLFISIITPGLAQISAGSRREFIVAVLPKYLRYLAIVSIVAVVAGLLLLVYINQVAPSLAPSAGGSPFIAAGALIGLVALIVAFAVVIPTGNKLVAQLRSSGASSTAEPAAPSPLILAIQRRLRAGAGIAVGLLGLALILMVVGASI